MNYQVKSIDYQDCKEWFLKKHYAKRIPSVSFCFGLYSDKLEGVCSFGFPPNYKFNNGKCVFNNFECLTLELNRLIVNDGLMQNTLSFFISNCLKKLPKPCCVVSYADPNNGHHGYIYQATNWIYTGVSTPKKKYVYEDGSVFDVRRRSDTKGKLIKKIAILPTHRYLYFIGNKSDVKKMKKDLKMNIEPYPKGENKRYDASYQPTTQIKLL